MRGVMLTVGIALAVVLVGGCQSIQYKVIDDLPAPVFADEQLPVALPADHGLLAMDGTLAHKTVAKTGGDFPFDHARSANPLFADWERHGPDNAWRYIIIHHSATPDGNAAKFDREHRDKGWDELGYHFVIDNGNPSRDGLIEVGSRWRTQKHGAHCKTNDNRFNDFGIGVCLVGNFENDRPTAAQMASLKMLVGYLADQYHISVNNILGHGEAVATMHEAGRGTKCCGHNFDMDVFRQTIRNNRLASVRP